MTPYAKARTLASAGWLLYLVPLVWVLALRGSGDAVPTEVGALIALAMVTWIRRRDGAAAYVVSIVLGVLLLLQSIGYLAGDLADDTLSIAYPMVDALALLAALAVVVGSGWALRTRSAAAAPAPA